MSFPPSYSIILAITSPILSTGCKTVISALWYLGGSFWFFGSTKEPPPDSSISMMGLGFSKDPPSDLLILSNILDCLFPELRMQPTLFSVSLITNENIDYLELVDSLYSSLGKAIND
jgi:hypothetical protein